MGTSAAPVSSASAAGPRGIRAAWPQSVTSTALRLRSRSASSGANPPARRCSASRGSGGSPPVSGRIVMPSEDRKATNSSYRRSGRSRSATVITGTPVAQAQAPAQSQLPWCGSAATTPRPASYGVRSRSSWTVRTRATRSSVGHDGSRNDSHQ